MDLEQLSGSRREKFEQILEGFNGSKLDETASYVPIMKLRRPFDSHVSLTEFRLPSETNRQIIKIGRNATVCEVFIYCNEHPHFLSRVHSSIVFLKDERGVNHWVIIECQTINGVFINDVSMRELEFHELKHNDIVSFGNPTHSFFVEYQFQLVPPSTQNLPLFKCMNLRDRNEEEEVNEEMDYQTDSEMDNIDITRPTKRRKTSPNKTVQMLQMMDHTILPFFSFEELFQFRLVSKEINRMVMKYIKNTPVDIVWKFGWNLNRLNFITRVSRNISSFDARGCYFMSNEHLRVLINRVPAIQHINISGCGRLNNQMIELLDSKCTNLKSFEARCLKTLHDNRLLESVVEKNPHLERLDLYGCNIHPNILKNFFKHLKCLKILNIGSTGYTNVTDSVIYQLTYCCPLLEEINVTCCSELSDLAIRAIATTYGNTLKRLNLHCIISITDQSLIQMASHMIKLEEIKLHRCTGITEQGFISFIQACGPQLKVLDISGCEITQECLFEISLNCPNLQVLDLRLCKKVTNPGVYRILLKCEQLRHIDLFGCELIGNSLIKLLISLINQKHGKLEHFELGAINKVSPQMREKLTQISNLNVY